MKSPLILVSNKIGSGNRNGSKLYNGQVPRQDYVEIAQKLAGTLLSYDLFNSAWYDTVRRIERFIKLDVVEAMSCINQCSKHNAFFSTSEKIAIPLSMMASMVNRNIPHVVVAHKLSSKSKKFLFKVWPIHKAFGHTICICRSQADYAVNQLGMSESKVDFIYHNVDQHFYHPLNEATDGYILTVGREQRDYETLFQAISGTDIKLVIVASSPWSTNGVHIRTPENVSKLSHIPYHELRALYAGARLVVIPLFDVDHAAGTTTLLEAMAMAKPVIVSYTRGISDYLVHNETGVYVPPQDPIQLREAILSLWHQPAIRNQLGANARQAVEEHMNIDIYADQVAKIVENMINSA